MNARIMIVLVGLAILGLSGVAAVDSANQEAGERVDVNDETFEPVGDTVVTLNNSNVDGAYYDENVTVVNASTTYEPSGNYTWHDNNGTIGIVNNSDLANQSTANISYGYVDTTEHQQNATRMLALLLKTEALLVLVVGAALALFAARVLGGA